MAITTTICRCCQKQLVFPEDASVLECSACFTVNARPQAEGPTLAVLRRATEQRLRCDFTNAVNSYQHVLLDYPEEHEALWGLALCRYGVEYVDDPATNRRLPVVHGVRKKPMQLDSDFQQACDLAPEEVRAQYEQDAAYIDDAMAKTCELADACPPFDVFICHKTTKPGSDEYTEDYSRAFKLYHMLDKQGFRSFFAPMEMEGVAAGSDYEAAIYHALDTAKVMLVVCSDADYITSPWVRNEWSRFLEMADEQGGKRLLPLLYGSMSPMKLPRDFRARKLQAITMGEMGSAEQVIQAVRKQTGAAAKPAAPAPVQPKAAPQPVHAAGIPKPAPAYTPDRDFRIAFTEGGCEITRYAGAGGEVRIPPMIAGRPVVRLADSAFEDCSALTGVALPDSLTAIGMSAFSGCGQLTAITIPQNVQKIEESAFSGCERLASLQVAAGNNQYYARDNVLLSRDGTLIYCAPGAMGSTYTVPDDVTAIGDFAFSDCRGLTGIRLHSGIGKLSLASFSDLDNLRSLVIPTGVKDISYNPLIGALHGCTNLQSITVGEGNPSYYTLGDMLLHHNGTLLRYAPASPWMACIVPEGVKKIGDYAFAACANLMHIDLPESLEEIGFFAFSGCPSLTTLTIPRGVSRIRKEAFAKSPSLVLRVHEGSAAHACAVENGLRFEVIPGPKGNWSSPDDFRTEPCEGGCRITGYQGEDEKVIIPPRIGGKPVVEIDNQAFSTNVYGSITEIVLPETLERMDGNPFYHNWNLETISVPENNRYFHIVDGALISAGGKLHCYPQKNVGTTCTVAASVKSIDAFAFADNEALTEVTLPDGLTSIGYYAFDSCSSLKSINLPDSLTTIEGAAFCECSSLQRLHVPRSVTVMEDDVFAECTNLTLLVHEGSSAHQYALEYDLNYELVGDNTPGSEPEPSEDDYAPDIDFDVESLDNGWKITAYLGEDAIVRIPPTMMGMPILEIESEAFNDAFITEIHLPEHVRKADDAFWLCPDLQAFTVSAKNPYFYAEDGVLLSRDGTLWCYPPDKEDAGYRVPEGVRVIASYAFSGCSHLKNVHLPDSLTQLRTTAFIGCTELESIHIPRNVPLTPGIFTDCDRLTLHVWEDSPAHRYAREKKLDYTLIHESGRAVKPAEAPAAKASPAVQPAAQEPASRERSIGNYVIVAHPYREGCVIEKYTGSDREVLIPATLGGQPVISIGEYAFFGNGTIESVTIPAGVTRIEESAFRNCARLQRISLPATLVNIDEDAFCGCMALSRMELPKSLVKIGKDAFAYCDQLPFFTKMKLKRMGAM